ncbi:UDP-glycosyltransferase UGT5-like [Eupeodes corollae]|uniref:UDP-glycosyltransferase UGT5-like n=1 Tax=Eupeodes corollae TaxID=290404 RepID=UPI0024922C59|nr:UDP-glycosyltransferase UGT5-like [Eupeodes corollae]
MKLQTIIFGSLLLLHYSMVRTEASNILGVFLSPSPSHVIVHMGIARALIDQGHNLTIITSMPLKDKNPAFRHIHLKSLDISTGKFITKMNETPLLLKPFAMYSILKEFGGTFSNFSNDPAFISFMKEDNHFDLMLHGYVFNDYLLGLAAHFKCPVVLSWIVQPFGQINRLIGNPINSEFVPFAPFFDPKPMDFPNRVVTFMANVFERILSEFLYIYSEKVYTANFPPDKYPTLKQMQNNISMVLFNHHFSEGPIRPLVPGLVEIGGIQVKDKPDPLPSDVKKFLDNSTKGAIFFSLGSNVKANHIGPEVMELIYKTLSSLPYDVIWKIDTDKPLGTARNILFKNWLPQDDILAHKNLKLFITHAGKGSVTEAEYHQVPMVALPVFGDQPANAQIMQDKGHGISLDHTNLTETLFRNTILEVMENDKYRNAIERFSKLYRDRPLTARQNAVYWIEYVIRHRGAPHMQSPLRTMNFFQQNSIDVLLFLGVSIYLIYRICKISLRLSILIMKKMLRINKTKKD